MAVVTGKTLGISDRFVAQCSPVLDTNFDTCGTVVRTTIAHLTPSQLEDLFTPSGVFADLDAWFKHSIEMKACGTRRYTMYDWIMANADRSNFRAALFPGMKAVKGPGLLHPFIMARTTTVVNNDHWIVLNGSNYANKAVIATTNSADLTETYTQNSTTKTATHVVEIQARWDIPANENFFRPGDRIHIFSVVNGIMQHGQWQVVSSTVDAASAAGGGTGNSIFVAIVTENAGSDEPYATNPGGAVTGQTPSKAYIIPGINNVNDYEKWCNNRPTLDNRKMVPFWRQTFRQTRCVDSQYREVFARLMESNEAFRQFGDLPLAEANRQDEAMFQRRFVHSFFYNKPISASQTLALYQNLEKIYAMDYPVYGTATTASTTAIMAYRANFIGVREQLKTCTPSSVLDLLGNQLNWLEWLDINYAIKRVRETMLGREVKDIDWYTNTDMANLLDQAYVKYLSSLYKDSSGTNEIVRVTVDGEQKFTALGQPWRSYNVRKPAGCRINVIVDTFFDDLLDDWDNISQQEGGNVLACLDIGKPGPNGGSIYWAQIAANRKSFTTASLEELAKIDTSFQCVMNTISKEQTLTSQEGTVVVECPMASRWIENISLEIPDVSGRQGTYTDAYTYPSR